MIVRGRLDHKERGETKLDLVRYYLAVAEPFLRASGGRPTLMQRFPNGAQGTSFFQKRVPKNAPEWLQTTIVSDQGPASKLASALGRDLKGKSSPLLYAAGIGASFVNRWVAMALYVTVALMWLVPDRRIESIAHSDRPSRVGD